MSKRRSDTRCARFFPVLTALLFAFFFLCPAGIYADEAATFPVTYELTHLTSDGPDEVTAGEDLTVTLTPYEGYALPDEIEVYVDGELLTAGEDYSYDPYGYLDDEDWDEDEGADEDDFDDEGDEFGDEVDESDDEDDSDEAEDTGDEGDIEDENDGFDDGEDSGDTDDLDDEDLDAEDDEFGSEEDFGSADDPGDEDESNDEDDELNAEDESDSEDLDEENRDDEEDPNDEGDEFDDEDDFGDEDDEFDDEDWEEVDYDDSTALTVYGEHVTGPVLIRACADELEYASSDVSFDDYMAKGTTYADTEPPLSAPPAPASADEKDRSPATGDDDISGAAFILLGTSLLTLIILQRKRATR